MPPANAANVHRVREMIRDQDPATPSTRVDMQEVDLQELARRYNTELVVDRGTSTEAYALEIIRDLQKQGSGPISIKDITSWFVARSNMTGQWSLTEK